MLSKLLTLSVLLEHGNHLIDHFLRRMASALTLLDLLDIATALGDEVVNVQHCVSEFVKGGVFRRLRLPNFLVSD
jgi:hypothetical protein